MEPRRDRRGRPPEFVRTAEPSELARAFCAGDLIQTAGRDAPITFNDLLKNDDAATKLRTFVESQLTGFFGDPVRFRSLRTFREWSRLERAPGPYVNPEHLVSVALIPDASTDVPAILLTKMVRPLAFGSWYTYRDVMAFALRARYRDLERFSAQHVDQRNEAMVLKFRLQYPTFVDELRRPENCDKKRRFLDSLHAADEGTRRANQDIVEALTEKRSWRTDGKNLQGYGGQATSDDWKWVLEDLLDEPVKSLHALQKAANRGHAFLQDHPHIALAALSFQQLEVALRDRARTATSDHQDGEAENPAKPKRYVECWMLNPAGDWQTMIFSHPARRQEFDELLRHFRFPERRRPK